MLLLYDNLLSKTSLAGYTLLSSGDATGYPKENIADWLDFDFWKADAAGTEYVEVQFTATQPADTLAIYAHDIYTNGGSVKVRRYDSGAWTQVGTTLTPTSDGLHIIQFASATDTRWRMEVTSTPASKIGVAFLGAALTIDGGSQIGIAPPLVQSDEVTINRAAGGALLGIAGKPKASDVSIDIELQTPAWIRASWQPFLEHAKRRAFIFAWNEDDLTEAWWCWCEQQPRNAEYTHATYMKAPLSFKATDGL